VDPAPINVLFRSSRHFQIWQYRVSHRQLLIRSVLEGDDPSRIEVLFRNVAAIKIATAFDGLVIREPSPEELSAIRQQAGPSVTVDRAFVIEALDLFGYIVASNFSTAEDNGDYKTPSSLLI
jgi:hypothetical protein